MRLYIFLGVLLAATFANAAPTAGTSAAADQSIIQLKISFECTNGRPLLNRWYLNMYTSKNSALSFSSTTDQNIIVHDNLVTLMGPRDAHGNYAYIVDLGHVMVTKPCGWTPKSTMIASPVYDIMIEDGLSLVVTHNGPTYMCRSTWADDKLHQVTEPTRTAVLVKDLSGAQYRIQPGQCQFNE